MKNGEKYVWWDKYLLKAGSLVIYQIHSLCSNLNIFFFYFIMESNNMLMKSELTLASVTPFLTSLYIPDQISIKYQAMKYRCSVNCFHDRTLCIPNRQLYFLKHAGLYNNITIQRQFKIYDNEIKSHKKQYIVIKKC
jgi:hypothetical protein